MKRLLQRTFAADGPLAGSVSNFKLRTEQRPNVREGDQVHVAMPADALHVFERDGGMRRD